MSESPVLSWVLPLNPILATLACDRWRRQLNHRPPTLFTTEHVYVRLILLMYFNSFDHFVKWKRFSSIIEVSLCCWKVCRVNILLYDAHTYLLIYMARTFARSYSCTNINQDQIRCSLPANLPNCACVWEHDSHDAQLQTRAVRALFQTMIEWGCEPKCCISQ